MSYSPPDHFRYVQFACSRLGLQCEDLDSGGGYLFRVSQGTEKLVLGAGRLCPYPLNSAAAFAVSKDKAFTNRLLDEAGIANLGGRAFFVSDLHSKLRRSGYEIADALSYLEEQGFPCFCKPLTGSMGDFAQRLDTREQFFSYLDRVRTKHDSIIIQRLFSGDEYRVFVLDGRALFCLKKAELELEGDGQSRVSELVNRINESLRGTGISPIADDELLYRIDGQRLHSNEVLPAGERVSLQGRRNFSINRSLGVFCDPCPPELATFSCAAAETLGLRIAGVDIFQDRDGEFRVIEVNGKPGMHVLEAVGRWDLIEQIWSEIFQKAFAERSVQRASSRRN